MLKITTYFSKPEQVVKYIFVRWAGNWKIPLTNRGDKLLINVAIRDKTRPIILEMIASLKPVFPLILKRGATTVPNTTLITQFKLK